jgi:mannose/fructose/N-acetylgalactosamine-specific phosphotransferase system component IIC
VTIPLIGTLLWGGVAAADATAFGQVMVSQPLVAAAVLGWLWGDLPLAIGTGALLQLLAAASLPLGARTPEDYAAGGVVGVGVALALASGHPFASTRDAAALVGVMAGMLASLGGVPLARWQRRRNETLSRWCEQQVAAGNESALGAAQWAGVALACGVGVFYCAAWLAGGVMLGDTIVHRESLRLARAWALAQPLLLGFGVAQLLHGFVRRRPHRVLLFAAALVAAWLAHMLEAP